MLCTNKQESGLRDNGSNAKTRYVSRFEPLALHPRLHRREGFLTHYLPLREPPPRRICYNTGSTELLTQYKTPPHTRGVVKTTTNTSTEVGYNHQLHLSLEGANTNLHLYQRGSKHQPKSTTSTSTKEGAIQEIKGLQQVVYFNHKALSFFHKTRS